MNGDSHRLLNEILEEAAPVHFRDVLLNTTLRHVRHRRRRRHAYRSLMVIALLISPFALVWKGFHEPPTAALAPLRSAAPSAIEIVHSHPLSPALLVLSNAGNTEVIRSSPGTVEMVDSASAGVSFKELTDEDLLRLLKGHPAALVEQGPHLAELVFVNAEDEKGFPLN